MECSICLEPFNQNDRRPKVLGCGHSYCQQCLERLAQKQCPVDKKVFAGAVEEQTDNFHLLQILHTDSAAATMQQLEASLERGLASGTEVLRHLDAAVLRLAAHAGDWRQQCQQLQQSLQRLRTAEVAPSEETREQISVAVQRMQDAESLLSARCTVTVGPTRRIHLQPWELPLSNLLRLQECYRERPEAELVTLPDDELLAVLAFLPPRQLFVCRAVCRRLRELCLHADLWRAVSLDITLGEGCIFLDKGVALAALALAPCLVKFTCRPTEDLVCAVQSTKCVVTSLRLFCEEKGDATRGVAIVSKLATLGGLKELHLDMDFNYGDLAEPLFRTAYGLTGLQRLEILDRSNELLLPAVRIDREVGPSLTSLNYRTKTADPFLKQLLRTHSASLESVQLDDVSNVPVQFLVGIPRLKSLECSPADDLSQLVALPHLQKIVLDSWNGVAYHPGALTFLAESSQLRHVELDLPVKSPAAPLIALSGSRSARAVETLVLWPGVGRADLAELMASVLPKFPSMKSLTVRSQLSIPRLQAVSSLSPCLTLLEVWGPSDTCLHSWLHDFVTLEFLARNRRLHLRVRFKILKNCSCQWCSKDCHTLESYPTRRETIAFSSHRRMKSCPFDCFQVL